MGTTPTPAPVTDRGRISPVACPIESPAELVVECLSSTRIQDGLTYANMMPITSSAGCELS
jgi:hypothetical protein